MATQSIEFAYVPGQSGSLSVKLYAPGVDAVVATSSAVTEGTNATGRYLATFTNVAAGYYEVQILLSGVSVAWASVTLAASAGTYPVQDLLQAASSVLSGITSLANWLRALARSSTPDTTALNEINSGGGTFDATADSLQKIATSSSGGQAGPGGTACTVTIKDNNNVPVPQMAVWLTSDQAGTTTVAGTLYTDDNGNVTFMLVSGNTYYLWARKSGENPLSGIPYVAGT